MQEQEGTAKIGKRCLHCGKPLPNNSPRRHCSTECRRAYQNERRKRERREESKKRRGVVLFCPVCGVPRRYPRASIDKVRYCSLCCRAIAQSRQGLGVRTEVHPPSYDLALHLANLPRDPWRAQDMTEDEEETIWGNALMEPWPEAVLMVRQYSSK